MDNDIAARCERMQCEHDRSFSVLTKHLLAAGVCAGVFLNGCRRLCVFRLLAVLHGEAPEDGSVNNACIVDKFTDSLQQANASSDFLAHACIPQRSRWASACMVAPPRIQCQGQLGGLIVVRVVVASEK